MDPAEQINGIIDAIQERVTTVLGLTAEDVYESRQTGEASGPAAYISFTIPEIQPLTNCADRATVEVQIGFHVEVDTAKRDRAQRMEIQSAIRDVLVFGPGHPDKMENVGLERVTSMGGSDTDDPDEGYLMGGLSLRFDTVLRLIEAP